MVTNAIFTVLLHNSSSWAFLFFAFFSFPLLRYKSKKWRVWNGVSIKIDVVNIRLAIRLAFGRRFLTSWLRYNKQSPASLFYCLLLIKALWWCCIFFIIFLDESSHLYIRVCPSVCPSISNSAKLPKIRILAQKTIWVTSFIDPFWSHLIAHPELLLDSRLWVATFLVKFALLASLFLPSPLIASSAIC